MTEAHIKKTLKPFAREIILAIVVLFSIVGSYYVFQSYKPKALRQVREVKGYKEESFLRIPYMQGAKELGVSETAKSKQVTLEIRRSPDEVRNFYKNVFTDRGWTRSSTATTKAFYNDTYKTDEHTAAVTISREDPIITVVDLNIRNN